MNASALQRQAASLDAATRATLIHRSALSGAQERLWRAAIGSIGRGADAQPALPCESEPLDLQNLLLLATATTSGNPQPSAAAIASNRIAPCPDGASTPLAGLGANAHHAGTLTRAAERTGVPPTALAAIVDAEAAKGAGGRWNTRSRNPRSSAAGLGQFLSGTWLGMAERKGSWLNAIAAQRGWLDAKGRVQPSARAAALALRYDPVASIETTADYAAGNLAFLGRRGIRLGHGEEDVARAAYLAHHLGPGDAATYLTTGLSDRRAGTLLAAQVGHSRATVAIASTGDASRAHRAWLEGYVTRTIRPTKFA